MQKLHLGAAVVLAIACGDEAKKPASPPADTTKPAVVVEKVVAVDSAARQNTDFEPARTDAVKALETFAFDSNRVDSAAIYALSLDELRLLRGLVFGRHGRQFADDAFIMAYLQSQPWYKPDSAFTNAALNETERDNLDVIRGEEASRHDRIMPGDLRYYRGRPVTSAMLGHHTHDEWRLLSSEVLAINGHEFNDWPAYDPDWEDKPDSTKALQYYYNNRYWYRPVGSLKLAELPPEDRAMLDSIEVSRIRDLGSTVGVGAMRLFQATPLTEKNLEHTDIIDLRLMRNEIFALRGRKILTPWIRRELEVRGYQPSGTFTDADLTDIDRQNLALIRRFEEQRHAELSTKEITPQNFARVPVTWVRLLRDEIYARHGRVFKNKASQAYFAAMPWYKPNPAFSESMLTQLEKTNAELETNHEKIMAQGGYPEG